MFCNKLFLIAKSEKMLPYQLPVKMAATTSIPITNGPSITMMRRDSMPSISNTAMPSLSSDAMPTSSESYSYSIAIPNGNPGSTANPYITYSNLPTNLVFIIVGAIIGAILLGFAMYRIVSFITGRRLAKSDKEVYYSNPSSLYQFGGSSSSNSSFFEKSSLASTASINQLSKHGSVVWLAYRDLDSSSNDSSTPGRLYRQAITGNEPIPRRNSMFVSPVLEVMNKRNSQLDLPLFNNRNSQYELPLFHDSSSGLNSSFVKGSDVDVSDAVSRNDVTVERPRMKRPPSQYLDDLIGQ